MTDRKAVTIRLTQEEVKALKAEAIKTCMSLSQYLRYKLLQQSDANGEFSSGRFLDKNLPLITRLIINSHLHIRQLALQQISKEDLSAINRDSLEEFQKLGIEKQL